MSALQTFVLSYLQELGSLVERTAPGIHEVVLPDAVAHQWRVPAYQQLAFDEAVNGQVTHLDYTHPFVETMIAAARAQAASTMAYITGLRLDKPGLAEVVRSSWNLPNSRVVERRDAVVARVRSTYIRFNFKAALVSDEKHEQLVSILMDANAGYAAPAPEPIMQAVNAVQPDVLVKSLANAPMRWTAPDGTACTDPLAAQTLQELLHRTQAAVLRELADPLQTLQRRSQRFLELDEARLQDYYDDMAHDLQQRLASAQAERRDNLEEKLRAVEAERTAKLADVAERYRVRLDLTLLNLMVIVQPKLALPVSLETRTTKLATYAVWDPLLHRVEPLACTVCGLPSDRTFLCHHGHLAHDDCLAPACVDCKRVFCRRCADAVGYCAVCQQPLCRYSRLACEQCGRGTCQAHTGLCHANAGQPVDLGTQTLPPAAPEPTPPPPPAAAVPTPKPAPHKPLRYTPRPSPSRLLPARRLPPGTPAPQRLEVVLRQQPDAVVAYVLASRERQVAMRVWELQSDGIAVFCRCELGPACAENNVLLRPVDATGIERQLLDALNALRQEYGIPPKKVHFNRLVADRHVPLRGLALHGGWKDEVVLRRARAGFDRLPSGCGRR